MAGKLYAVSLTQAEIDHLTTLLHDAEEAGCYYGPRGTYWARHDRIREKLITSKPVEKAEEARREWQRAEQAEAERDRLAAKVERLARKRDDAMMRAEQAEAALATTNRVLDNRMARLLEAEAERDRLAAEVERLLQALRNIRLAAARGRTFGHQATLQPHVRMAARKDEALEHVLQFCAQLGVEGSLLRKANAALAEVPTLCQSPDCQMSGPHELTECCPGGEHLIGGPAEAPTPAREEGQ